MAITTQNSTEYGNQVASPVVKQAPSVIGGRVRVAKFTFAQSGVGDAGSIINLAKLPAGNIRVLAIRVAVHTDYGAARTLDFGYAANVDVDGVAVVADPDAYANGIDMNNTTVINQVVDKTIVTRDGLIVTGQVNDGALADADTLEGFIEFVLD